MANDGDRRLTLSLLDLVVDGLEQQTAMRTTAILLAVRPSIPIEVIEQRALAADENPGRRLRVALVDRIEQRRRRQARHAIGMTFPVRSEQAGNIRQR